MRMLRIFGVLPLPEHALPLQYKLVQKERALHGSRSGSRVGSGSFSQTRGSSRVGPGRVGSARVGAGGFQVSTVGSGHPVPIRSAKSDATREKP